jgi:hypothetical protein
MLKEEISRENKERIKLNKSENAYMKILCWNARRKIYFSKKIIVEKKKICKSRI